MPGIDLSTVPDALKIYYPQQEVMDNFYRYSPFLKLMPKEQDGTGKVFETLLHYGAPTARSANIANSITQSLTSFGKYASFKNQTYAKDYGTLVIDQLTMDTAKPEDGAFLDVLKRDQKNIVEMLGKSMAQAVWRGKGGTLGATTTTTGTTIQLVNPQDQVNLEVGDVIQFATLPTGGTLYTDTPDFRVIVSINRDAGSFVVNTSVNGYTLTGTSYILKQGDYENKMYGFLDYITKSATPGTLWGLNRDVDPRRLSGLKFTRIGANPEEILIDVLTELDKESADPTHIFCPHKFWSTYAKSLGSHLVLLDAEEGKTGFKAIQVFGPNGPLKLIADPFIPSDTIAVVQMDTWKMHTVGEAPRMFDKDVPFLRNPTDDSYQARFGYFGQITNLAPGKNAVVTIDP